jgi:hypothetical protein
MIGRYGTYVLVDDLQKSLYKDAVTAAKDGEVKVAEYAETVAENLEKLKN